MDITICQKLYITETNRTNGFKNAYSLLRMERLTFDSKKSGEYQSLSLAICLSTKLRTTWLLGYNGKGGKSEKYIV